MIKLVGYSEEEKLWILALILEFVNLDGLLEDKPITFSAEELGLPFHTMFVVCFETPTVKAFLEKIEGDHTSRRCVVLMLPLAIDKELRKGMSIQSEKSVGGTRLRIGIMATDDVRAAEAEIRKSGKIGPQTIIRRTGHHPDEKLNNPN